MSKKEYIETFDNGPGGWIGWDRDHADGTIPLEIRDSAVVSRSPWSVDPNHAPPGAGYLSLLFILHTCHFPGFPQKNLDAGGPNRFVQGRFSTDFRNVKLHVRLRGEVNLRGAQLVLLAQSNLSKDPQKPNWVNQALTSQPLKITRDWSEQTLHLTPDQAKWTELGARHDCAGFYGKGPIEEVLRVMNGDIIFVLFPLDVAPDQPIKGDPHILNALFDYKPDRARLPDGHVMLDEVRIEYP